MKLLILLGLFLLGCGRDYPKGCYLEAYRNGYVECVYVNDYEYCRRI